MCRKRCRQTGEKVRPAQMLFHGFFVVDGEIWIKGIDLAANRFGKRSRVTRGVDNECVAHQRGIVRDALVKRTIEDWACIFTEGAGFGISDDSNNLIVPAAPFQVPADGISVRK